MYVHTWILYINIHTCIHTSIFIRQYNIFNFLILRGVVVFPVSCVCICATPKMNVFVSGDTEFSWFFFTYEIPFLIPVCAANDRWGHRHLSRYIVYFTPGKAKVYMSCLAMVVHKCGAITSTSANSCTIEVSAPCPRPRPPHMWYGNCLNDAGPRRSYCDTWSDCVHDQQQSLALTCLKNLIRLEINTTVLWPSSFGVISIYQNLLVHELLAVAWHKFWPNPNMLAVDVTA